MTYNDIANAPATSRPVDHRIAGAIRLVREAWANDGAEGESVHLLADEVERLTKLHAETHAQNERMCAEIERLDREVAQLRARVTSYDALAVQASEVIDALSAVCDRVGTIASEAFGPLPVQPAAANLTAIEQGIAKQHREIERLRALADGADLAVLALESEADQARAEIARLTAVINSGLAEVYG